MAQSLISLITLAGIVAAAPLVDKRQTAPPDPTATITFVAEFTTYIPPCEYTYYSVAGDTCTSIGAANGQSGDAIHEVNAFLDCNNIWPGTPICVPPASTLLAGPTSPADLCIARYTAVAGDTCDSIGALYGVPGWVILEGNPYVGCDDVWAGTDICILDVNPPTPTATITGTFSINPDCITTYYSGPGDTCESIAGQYGISAADVLLYNSFLNCTDIWNGTPICIPPPEITTSVSFPTPTATITGVFSCSDTYYAGPGDTCEGIAGQFGISAADVLLYNSFLNCTDIWDGTPICIPSPEVTSTVSFPTPTATITGIFSIIPDCITTYYSGPGDTCESIGNQYGVSDAEILLYNSFLDCQNIWTNTPVCIPPPPSTVVTTAVPPTSSCVTTYTSVEGDSCGSIASQYGITGSDILAANTFLDCENIWPWTPVCIPFVLEGGFSKRA